MPVESECHPEGTTGLAEKKQQKRLPKMISESELSLIINEMHDGFWITDLQGHLLEVNDAYVKMSGYTREELLSMSSSELEADGGSEGLVLRMAGIIESGVDRFAVRHRRRDGSMLCLEVVARLSSEAGGRLLSVLHEITLNKSADESTQSSHDTTEKLDERSEVAPLNSFDEIQDLYNNAPCGFHSLNDEGVFVQINDTELSWLGYSRSEVLGKKRFTDLITDTSRDLFYRTFTLFKKRGWINDLEFDMIRRNGSILNVLLSATSVRDADGNYLMSRSTVYDITERKQIEEKVARLNRIYAILSRINEAIVRAREPEDLYRKVCQIGVEEGGFLMVWVGLIDWNSRKVKPAAFCGVEEDYLKEIEISVDDINVGRGPTGTAVREGRHDVCEDFESDPRMAPWRDNALKRGFRSSIAFPLKVAGETAGVLTLYAREKNFFNDEEIRLLQQLTDDMSFAMEFMAGEQKRRENEAELGRYRENLEELVKERTEQLTASNEKLRIEIFERMKAEERIRDIARKLTESNRELEMFAYVASHDLREPLRKITVFGERLRNHSASSLDEKGLDYLARMESAAKRMKLLIDGVMHLSRITTVAVEKKPVELSRVLEEVKSDLEVLLQEKSAVIDADCLPVVEADPLQMRQLFMNILSNSVKYCEGAPRITVRSRRTGEGMHEISITDNGIGFDEKHIHDIFMPFNRLHGRDEYEGVGMGLAICQRIVSRHNGSISAKSAPGAGSTFTITLPALP